MAMYWGLDSICQRMGWRDRRTPVRHLQRYGFPIIIRRHGPHPRRVYYTNDNLITQWEMAMVRVQREELLAQLDAKQGTCESHNSGSAIRR